MGSTDETNPVKRPTPATVSESIPCDEAREDKYAIQKPDSTSTGILGKMAEDYANTMPEPSATPSGDGEWTNNDDILMMGDVPIPMKFMCDAKAVAVAHNAALRDCGNDKKRLERLINAINAIVRMIPNDERLANMVPELDELEAAMLETGEQTKEKE